MPNFLRKDVPCFVCGDTVTKEHKIYMLGIERPYINLIMHFDCYQSIRGVEAEFILENLEKYLNLGQKQKNTL